MQSASLAMRFMWARLLSFLFFLCYYSAKLAGSFDVGLICSTTADLTTTQRELCREVPRAMVVLSDVIATFEDECKWQFKTSRWNCTGVQAPVYVDTGLGDTPELAFVQALTSAITVYKIAEACQNGELGPYCSSIAGTSYQANINTGKSFAQRFLDNRPLVVLGNGSSTREELIQAQLQIHNNGAGRLVVFEKKRVCRCVGTSGSCTLTTCTDYMPSIFEIGDTVKKKHSEALKVTPVVQDGVVRFQLVQQARERPGEPPATELIYIDTPTNHCTSDPAYTTARYCLPQSNLTSEPTLRQYYPPCEEFCCSGHYEARTKATPQFCNCHFEFCCSLKCETCGEETFTEYTCSENPS